MRKDNSIKNKAKRLNLAVTIKAMAEHLEEQVDNNSDARVWDYATPTDSKKQVIVNTCKQMRLYLNELRKLYE